MEDSKTKILRRAMGLPDGNGHGWNGVKVFRTAFVTAAAGSCVVGIVHAARWTGNKALDGINATAAIYRDVPIHGRDIEELRRETLALKAKVAPASEIAKEVVRQLREEPKGK